MALLRAYFLFTSRSFFLLALCFSFYSPISYADSTALNPQAIERGKTSSALCATCHQANGSGMDLPQGESWPRLAGLNRDYLIAQVTAFKVGTRQSPTMTPFAHMLNEEQLYDVASYYASLPAPAVAAPTADAALLAHGKKLALVGDWDRYIVPCQSCHGEGNRGHGAIFPGIAGQQPSYIAQQLTAWQQGSRSNDAQHLMGAIAARLTSHDIAAVSAWLATQPAQSL